jgi:hypothetical protein
MREPAPWPATRPAQPGRIIDLQPPIDVSLM